jgi:glutamine synthetase
MLEKDKEFVLRTVREQNVKFIRLWFTDVLGFLKSFAVTASELELGLEEGFGFDGSSIEGYARIQESDMIAMPDPSTFQLLPWRTGDANVARMFCDVLNPDGSPCECDPRYVLKRNLERARKLGYTFYVGPELEYYYLRDSQSTEVLDRGTYFDLTPLDLAVDLRRDTVLTLEKMGIEVEYSHHEVGPSQHEIDLRYTDALTMADNCMTYRLVVKEIAQMHGIYATFMPKPMFGEAGNGMHTHQSLFQGDKNAFFDVSDKFHLSKTGKAYIAGILKHAKETTAVFNQWVNSYKRLVSGYEAPVYICWAQRNRSALVRVPMYKPGKEKATRVELRSPDPACNPYLAFAVMLAAGLDGIEKDYELPNEVPENLYEMTDEERKKIGVGALPEDLHSAIEICSESKLVEKALGSQLFEWFIRNKKMEWDEYRTRVTPFELEKYLPQL